METQTQIDTTKNITGTSLNKNSQEPIIDIKNLNVTYFLGKPNEFKALKNINLKIYPGEFVIFFGPSGCGKSTLLYSISGLETNIEGDVSVNGKNLTTMKEREKANLHQNEIGLIFQAYYLINSISVIKNVVLPQIAIGVKKSKRKIRANQLLERFGVSTQAHKLPNELSGGQQQRVAICRSLVNEPSMLLTDEPVGNLDSNSAQEVLKLLRDLNKNQKKTIVLVTHNPAHLDIAHRVFYMKDGAIINVKTNKALYEETNLPMPKEADDKVSVSRDLELLARSFSSIKGSFGNLLLLFKAKQIVSEVLTGMNVEEIDSIEKKVSGMLLSGVRDDQSLFKYLDDENEKGGMGMDKRTAENLSHQIKEIINEIKVLEEEEKKINFGGEFDLDKEVMQVRHYLLDVFNVNLAGMPALQVLNSSIRQRLDNKISKVEFQKALDLSIKKGGVGLDRRTAKKMTKRLELIILGKFK